MRKTAYGLVTFCTLMSAWVLSNKYLPGMVLPIGDALAKIGVELNSRVANNSALNAFPYGGMVERGGFAVAGDGGRALFTHYATECPAPIGADGGSCIKARDGGSWRVDPSIVPTTSLWGAIAQGADDTSALQAELNYAAQGHAVRFSCGNMLFTNTLTLPLSVAAPGATNLGTDVGGCGPHGTYLIYKGQRTTIDLMQIGNVNYEGIGGNLTQLGALIHDFTITSNTRMTGGTALHVAFTGSNNIQNVDTQPIDGNYANNLWNGIWFDRTGYNNLSYSEIRAQNDGLRVSAPSVITPPQYDFWAQHIRVGGSGVGIHVGGGWDGAHFDSGEITSNGTGVLIDHALSSSKNQELFFGPMLNIDMSLRDGYLIDDSFASNDSFYCNIQINGQITDSGGSGVRVASWSGCYINISPHSIEWNGNAGIDIEDVSAIVNLSPNTLVAHNESWGIYAGSAMMSLIAPGRGNIQQNGRNPIIATNWSSMNGGQITYTTKYPHGYSSRSVNMPITGFLPSGYNKSGDQALSGTGGNTIVIGSPTDPGTVTKLGFAAKDGVSNFSPFVLGTGLDNGPGNKAVAIKVGTSPCTIPVSSAGTLYFSGGLVFSIVQARPFSPLILTGQTHGGVQVRAGDTVSVTFSKAPAVTFVPN